MYASSEELATVMAKEIFLKLMDSNTLSGTPRGKEPLWGPALATHVGDCFKVLLTKVHEGVMAIYKTKA